MELKFTLSDRAFDLSTDQAFDNKTLIDQINFLEDCKGQLQAYIDGLISNLTDLDAELDQDKF
jgi:hypothetical protein